MHNVNGKCSNLVQCPTLDSPDQSLNNNDIIQDSEVDIPLWLSCERIVVEETGGDSLDVNNDTVQMSPIIGTHTDISVHEPCTLLFTLPEKYIMRHR